MNFAYPWALLGLLSVPIIILMYMFKRKYVNLEIPSLYLWKEAMSSSLAEEPWQKLRKNLLMILQIIIAILITLALANPYIESSAESASSIILLDASMSMQTNDEDTSRFQLAKKSIENMVNSKRIEDEISIIVMQENPYIAISSETEKNRLLETLSSIPVTNTSADISQSISLAKSLNIENESNVYYFSDDLNIDFDDMNAQNMLFGESASNTAIILLSYKIEDEKLICLAKVKNFGLEPIENELVIYADGVVHDIKGFSLKQMEEIEILISDLPGNTTQVEAKLSKSDLLEADDSAYLGINPIDIKKVMLFSNQNIFLENMINLLPNFELYKGSIDSMDNMSGYFIYIFDGVLPEILPEDGHIILFNPPVGNSLIETKEDIAIQNNAINNSESLDFMKDLDFDIGKSKKITMPAWASNSVYMGEDLIMVSGNRANQKVMILGFDLHNTNLPLKKEYPIFIYNIFQWFNPNEMISTDSIICGDVVNFDISPNSQKAEIILPSGKSIQIAPPFPPNVFYDTDNPGIYVLKQENELGETSTKFAVNVFNEKESNLLRETFSSDNSDEIISQIDSNRYFRNIILLFAILIIFIEWQVYCRGI